MPAPTCKKQVQQFIGMVKYLSKFSLRLSELAEPTRELELSKDKVPFNMGPEHQEAFKKMKEKIARAPILAYYNQENKQSCKQMQASKDWVYACYKMKNKYTLQVKH